MLVDIACIPRDIPQDPILILTGMLLNGLIEHISQLCIPLIQLLIPLQQRIIPRLIILILIPLIKRPPLQLLNLPHILHLVSRKLRIRRHEFRLHLVHFAHGFACFCELLPESAGFVPVGLYL